MSDTAADRQQQANALARKAIAAAENATDRRRALAESLAGKSAWLDDLRRVTDGNGKADPEAAREIAERHNPEQKEDD